MPFYRERSSADNVRLVGRFPWLRLESAQRLGGMWWQGSHLTPPPPGAQMVSGSVFSDEVDIDERDWNAGCLCSDCWDMRRLYATTYYPNSVSLWGSTLNSPVPRTAAHLVTTRDDPEGDF